MTRAHERADAPRVCNDCGQTKKVADYSYHDGKKWLSIRCRPCEAKYRREARRRQMDARRYVEHRMEPEPQWSFVELMRFWPDTVYAYWQSLAAPLPFGADD
jgi:hypothetical protein